VGVPFSIARMPLLAGHDWRRRDGKSGTGWAALFLVPFAAAHGAEAALRELAQVLFSEYLPFITPLLALHAAGGGVLLRGTLKGMPGITPPCWWWAQPPASWGRPAPRW